ncbi:MULTISPECIES: hypothetical protein [Actinoalloteichus]|uniref:hypothetical protein n=1 Tax=Actinoalloteichus TaxID=65496 RepID=UPI0012FC1A29|nr:MULTISPECIES: hypothetical protein [Actinoalloteichus]
MAIPCRADDLSDSLEVRARMGRIMERHTYAIIDNVTELGRLGLDTEVTAEVRVHRAAPLFTLYGSTAKTPFFGFYPSKNTSSPSAARRPPATTSQTRTPSSSATPPPGSPAGGPPS